MKFVTYRDAKDAIKIGSLINDDQVIVVLDDVHQRCKGDSSPAFASMQALIEGGVPARALVDDMVEKAASTERIDASSVSLLAPLPRPIQMRDCLCFEDHITNIHEKQEAATGQAPSPGQLAMLETMRRRPIWYKCNRMAVVGPDAAVTWPRYSQIMDYEFEIAAVIGKTGVNLSEEDAPSHIFGYSIFNDLSARDTQGEEMPGSLGPSKSKDFDGANILGPCIVTADEFDPYSAEMNVYINGERISTNTAEKMNPNFARLISFVSQHETIFAGEILCSGTVGGGSGFESGHFLNSGDQISLEMVGLGTLRNTVNASN